MPPSPDYGSKETITKENIGKLQNVAKEELRARQTGGIGIKQTAAKNIGVRK